MSNDDSPPAALRFLNKKRYRIQILLFYCTYANDAAALLIAIAGAFIEDDISSDSDGVMAASASEPTQLNHKITN
jgi:hypothetical protein